MGTAACNENIALSAIHQVFHSEHDRLVAQIEDVLTHDTTGATSSADWQLPDGAGAGPDSWNGERIFQAARFVNEMEYQHVVFEEFARKVAPGIPEFDGYSPDVNPAISAEFAQAVYRFGHSMLDEDVARKTADPATGAVKDDSIPLLTAFLNPPEYFAGGATGTLTPSRRRAACSWAPRTRSATRSTSSSPRPCATTCSACRWTWPRSTSPEPGSRGSRR